MNIKTVIGLLGLYFLVFGVYWLGKESVQSSDDVVTKKEHLTEVHQLELRLLDQSCNHDYVDHVRDFFDNEVYLLQKYLTQEQRNQYGKEASKRLRKFNQENQIRFDECQDLIDAMQETFQKEIEKLEQEKPINF